MSEQPQVQSNYQALGAGLLGFFAVMAVGGGVLMLHSSHRAKSAAAPAPAAAPIDLGSSMPRPSMPAASFHKERRAESPAPLIGDDGESAAEEAPAPTRASGAPAAPAAAEPSPESAPAAKASALEVARHLEAEGGSTAEAEVKNTVDEKKKGDKPAPKLAGKLSRTAPTTRLELPAGDGAVASTVHYGVTSRSELMGRAAGPVYNMKGGKGAGNSTAGTGKLAADADGKMADIRRQLEASGLPAEQRAKLLKDLDESMKRVEETGKTAQ